MKNIFGILILFLLSVSSLVAQQIVPSKAVQTAFEKHYPTITNPFWEVREGALVALFKNDDQLTKAFYEHNGQLREIRVRTPLTSLPEAVQLYVNTHFEDADITYVGLVTAPWKKALYRVESEVEGAVYIKLLNDTGELVQQERIVYSTTPQIEVVIKNK